MPGTPSDPGRPVRAFDPPSTRAGIRITNIYGTSWEPVEHLEHAQPLTSRLRFGRLAGYYDNAADQLPTVAGCAELDPTTLAEQASTAIAKLKSSGVTTVIIGGDPIAPKTFTEVATQQGYKPEWVLNGAALQDTTAFGRTYDQDQWSHAFGLSSLAARVVNGFDGLARGLGLILCGANERKGPGPGGER